jgi:hypothetical protein
MRVTVPTKMGPRPTPMMPPWLAAVLMLGALASVSVVTGCRVNEDDVHRWETTERGPEKLVAVLEHDKYAWNLRTEAGLSLIRMRPRAGRRIGIELLTNSLADLSVDARRKIVDGMTPQLVAQIQAPPPVKGPDGAIPQDPSIPFKDAAFAMLSHEPPLVSDDDAKAQITAAISQWVQTDFDTRLENPAQQYGVEQMMRFLGAPSVKGLPALITESSTKIDRIAGLVADIGDTETKQRASDALVALAKKIDSADWINKQTPLVEDADKRAGQKVTPQQLTEQVKKFQDQELTKVFASMKRVGGRSVVDYLLAFGGDPKNSSDRRKTALAALEGRIDKSATGDVERIFSIAKDDNTPDDVRDIAFQRLGELPKEQVIPKLYTLFSPRKWKVRWVAASLVLKTISTRQLPEFMSHLPASPAVKMGISEPISYGGVIAKMEPGPGDPKPKDVLATYMSSLAVGPKLTALAQYYQGKKADLGVLRSHEDDREPLPKCEKDDDCGWQCDVPKPGAADKNDKESKTVVTVGEFVRFCVEPSME